MSVILFFDDRYLNIRHNVQRRMGRAQLMSDTLYADPSEDIFANIPNVFYNNNAKKYYMLTYGTHLKKEYSAVLLAQSEDGLHWSAFDTHGIVQLRERLFDNQLLDVRMSGEFCLFDDTRARTDERYKLLGIRRKDVDGAFRVESFLYTSPDGLHWKDEERNWHPAPPDLGALCVYYNPLRKMYVILTRPKMVDRRVSYMLTEDWISFTPPQVMLSTDALDSPLCESYGLTVLPYENYYLGMYWLYHPSRDQINGTINGPSHKYFDGYVNVQGVYSEDGIYFQRGLRETIIANGEPGTPDCGCIYPRGMRLGVHGEILIDACIYPYEHGHWRRFSEYNEPHPSIGTYCLRKDGMVYFESQGGEGEIGSRALLWLGGQLKVNMLCPTGEARVQITDAYGKPIAGYTFAECETFSQDSIEWEPRWVHNVSMETFKGKVIRIEIRWKTGRLYAIRGNFQLLIGPEIEKNMIIGAVGL